jgi:hypothetical protein
MEFLLNSQKALLAQVIEENNFNPRDFGVVSIRDRSHGTGAKVHLKGTNNFFSIYPYSSEWDSNRFFVEYSPGEDATVESALLRNFMSVVYKFAEYLSFVIRESTTTHPWEEAGVTRVAKQKEEQTVIPADQHFTGQRLARAIFAEAKKSLDVLDPYLGPEFFDRIDDAAIQVPIRISTSPKSKNSFSYYKAFKQSYPLTELRVLHEPKLHDRFILVDKTTGYHLGHSVKDLGKKDTQISPIDIVKPQLDLFEKRWAEAELVT